MRPNGLVLSAVCMFVGHVAFAQPAPAPTPPTPPTPPAAPPAPATEPAPTTEPTPPPAPAPAPVPAATTTAPATTDKPLGTAFGVGIHAMLTGPTGPSLVYNASRFHIEGIIAFVDAEGTDLAIGGRAWFHVHQTKNSSLSLGGGLAIVNTDSEMVVDPTRPAQDGDTNINLEGGAQIRFFATENVALSASVGLAVVTGDADVIALTGQLTGAVGLTYFLF